MAGLAFSLDTTVFDRAVLRYVEELGVELPKAVKGAARLLAEDLLRLTPPKSQGQGRKAVARDINNAATVLNAAKLRNKVFAQAVRDQEYDVVNAFLARLRQRGANGFSAFHLEHFSPALHQRARNRRGRVPRSRGVLVLERLEHLRYVREIQGHVGSTKYAWGVGARRLGASVPGWILKHSSVHGEITEDYNPKSPHVVLANRGPGIDNLGSSLVQRAVNRRAKAMTKDVDQILKGRASRLFN